MKLSSATWGSLSIVGSLVLLSSCGETPEKETSTIDQTAPTEVAAVTEGDSVPLDSAVSEEPESVPQVAAVFEEETTEEQPPRQERRRGNRETIAMEDLPSNIRGVYDDFLANEGAGVSVRELNFKEKRGQNVYEFEMEKDGKHLEIEVSEDGEILELEREMVAAEIPDNVRGTIDSYLAEEVPGGIIGEVEYEEEDGKSRYEIDVTGEGGREMRMYLDAEGNLLGARERGERGGDQGQRGGQREEPSAEDQAILP